MELEDNFTAGMARAAASTALLKRELNSLSGTSVRTSRDNDTLSRSLKGVGTEATRTSSSLSQGTREIDKYSGRLGLLLRTAAVLGPAIVPIGAAAIPAIAGLTAGLGAAAGAFGVTLLAVQGLGDGMKALDAYQLEPTAENLAALRIEMDKLGPSGAEFVRFLDGIEPELRSLQDAARQGLFPGVEEGIDAMLTRLPQARRIIFDIATALGDVASDAGKGLAGDGFRDFFNYLETDAAPTLKAFAEATGNVAGGIANLIVGVAPLTRDFTGGMVAATQSFEQWTSSLAGTQGFQDFLSYIQQTGPQVAALIGQLATSLAAIVEAAAPVGQALLPALTAIAGVVETIAKSDLGTPLFAGLAAMSALRLATQAWGKIASGSIAAFVAGNARAAGSVLAVVSAQDRARMSAQELAATQAASRRTALVGVGRMAAPLAGLALASGALGDNMASSNASSMALMGTIAGPWGAAIGGAVGLVMDFKQSSADANSAIDALNNAMASHDPEAYAAALANVNAELESRNSNEVLGTSFLGDTLGGLTNLVIPMSNHEKMLGVITGSTDDLAEAARRSGDGVTFFGAQLEIAGNKTKRAVAHTEAVRSALLASRQAAQETAGAFLAFGDSLDDNKVSLNEWIAEQQKVANALRNFADNAADAARKGLDPGFIEKLKAAGPEGALRLAQLADASEEQIARINRAFRSGKNGAEALNDVLRSLKSPDLDVNDAQMRAKIKAAMASLREYGLTKAQASMLIQDLASGKVKTVQDLIDKYGLSKKAATALLNDLASGKIRAVQSLLNSLHDKTVTITTVHNDAYNSKRDGMSTSADGGTVPKTGLPYADRHPYLLADGEEVISNRYGQADRNRSLLKAINAGRLADGGTAGGDRNADGTTRSVKALQAALEKLTKSLEKETKVRDDILAVRGSVREGLRSDIFGASSSWGSASDPNGALRADIGQGQHFIALIKELRGKGVDGAALQEIIASGDVQRAELMASMTRSGLSTYERLYNRREQVLSRAGGAATTALGLNSVRDEIRDLRHDLKGIKTQIAAAEHKAHDSRQQAAKTTADGVNNGAGAGHRRGGKGR